MTDKQAIIDFYSKLRVPNPINFTLTFKQKTDGQWLDENASVRNVREFRNRLNSFLFGNAYKRYGKQLKMLITHEGTKYTRHHVHGVIELPSGWKAENFMELVDEMWRQTRFGYSEYHYEVPTSSEREKGWLHYCLKKRTKRDLLSSVDWENSTCFEPC